MDGLEPVMWFGLKWNCRCEAGKTSPSCIKWCVRRDDASAHSRTSNVPSDIPAGRRARPLASCHFHDPISQLHPTNPSPESSLMRHKTHLLHMNNIIPILRKLASDLFCAGLLASRNAVGVEDRRQAGYVHRKNCQVAGGGGGDHLCNQSTASEGVGQLHFEDTGLSSARSRKTWRAEALEVNRPRGNFCPTHSAG